MESLPVLAWSVFLGYALVTVLLALRGMKKTTDFTSFAIGKGDMGPLLVGITLASSIASSATFIINPGFVYTHGLSAFFHFAVASPAGFLFALFIFSKKFRRWGMKNAALTLPDWIRKRYKSDAMGTYFAVLNLLLSVTFVVLIIKGSALVMQSTLGLSYVSCLTVIVGFVFSYIILGGTYAHAYTNALQGFIMLAVALLIIASGAEYFAGGISGFLDRVASVNANLATATNPESPLYSNIFNVFFCSFVISIGLVCQPHILMKPLYLKSDKQVNAALLVTTVVSIVFASMLAAGFFARLGLPAPVSQDAVMATYISQAFSPVLGVFISVALLAAGMSTLDGILVGASTIAANDIVLGPLGRKLFHLKNEAELQQLALKFSRYILIFMGVSAFFIALNPPKLVGLFAQAGIYGLTAASIVPIAGGLLLPRLSKRSVFTAAVIGPLVHFIIYFYYKFHLNEIINPAVSATWGIGASVATVSLFILFIDRRFPVAEEKQGNSPLELSNV